MAYHRMRTTTQAGLASAHMGTGHQQSVADLLSSARTSAADETAMRQAAAGASLADTLYALSVSCVRLGDVHSGAEFLQRAIATGWRDAAWIEMDSDLGGLQETCDVRNDGAEPARIRGAAVTGTCRIPCWTYTGCFSKQRLNRRVVFLAE